MISELDHTFINVDYSCITVKQINQPRGSILALKLGIKMVMNKFDRSDHFISSIEFLSHILCKCRATYSQMAP